MSKEETKDGLKQCPRCKRWFSILYPLKSYKAYVEENDEVDMEDRNETYFLCEDCYDDFIFWVRDFLNYEPDSENWKTLFYRYKESLKQNEEFKKKFGI